MLELVLAGVAEEVAEGVLADELGLLDAEAGLDADVADDVLLEELGVFNDAVGAELG